MPDKNDVPLMYRAQVEGRCQLQRIYKRSELEEIASAENIQPEQYSIRWKNQWLEACGEGSSPLDLFETSIEEPNPCQTKEYTISWRFVTNGGQDDGIIRPVIGAYGLPFYPGSSMKGAFCKACSDEQKQRYQLTKDQDTPSLLRFHGGYPISENWKENLVDIVHPQQGWQVKTLELSKKPQGESGFALISLYQPTIKFGISSLSKTTDWEEIWQIWEKALGYGIGCRTSSSYGQSNQISNDVLYQAKLHGQGIASKLLSGELEFRPNIFRAAIRGHALRIFGGLKQSLAEDIVDELFGGIRSKKEKVGLLGMSFHLDDPADWHSKDETNTYDVTGTLRWILSQESILIIEKHRQLLIKLVEKLTQFAMLLGGFGNSWRRADHRIFYSKYTKHLIGCHWKWVETDKNIVHNLADATTLIQDVIDTAKQWMELRFPNSSSQESVGLTDIEERQKTKGLILRSVREKPQSLETWREAWRTDNVQVWGKVAKDANSSTIISWLHSSQRTGNQQSPKGNYHNQPKKQPNQSNPLAFQRGNNSSNQPSRPSIYRTDLTGRVKDESKSNEPTQIGRLWHRMYLIEGEQYLELITIFYQKCDVAENFIAWLNSEKSGFQKVW